MLTRDEFADYLKKEGPSIMAEVKANRTKLDGCTRHLFDIPKPVKMGAKYYCKMCGGQTSLTNIGWYIRGYVAHGGLADDIVPGWNG
jgi:hypothetical protein